MERQEPENLGKKHKVYLGNLENAKTGVGGNSMQKALTTEGKTDLLDFRFNNICPSKGTIREDT